MTTQKGYSCYAFMKVVCMGLKVHAIKIADLELSKNLYFSIMLPERKESTGDNTQA